MALVYDQVVDDLLDAQQLLAINYASAGKLRPNKYTATALLSRVYLYQKQWIKCEAEANKIINSLAYFLESNLNNVFMGGSRESIWEMPRLQSPRGVPEAFQFLPVSGNIPKYVITSFLLAAFETNDQRKVNWLNSTTIGASTYYYPYKYKVRSNANSLENYVMFRLAEQYLIRAEARANQNRVSEAITDLNTIRNRGGLPNTTAVDSASLIPAIYRERRFELFCEWGHRWYDLKRTNTVNSIIGTIKSGWQPTDALYPIFTGEIEANPFLTQNPGY
jgi:hypothetical protein